MSDQADSLRELVRTTVQAHPALEPGVPLIVLSGGRRGVGTSTLSLQLAKEIAQLGKRAVLIDANPTQPDLTNRLDLKQGDSLGDVLAGNRSAAEVLTPISERLRFLPNRWDAETPPELHRLAVKRFLGEIRSIHSHADIVLLDAGEGMSPWVGWLWKSAQQILLVTNTEESSIKESYATLKLAPWGDVDGKLNFVVNQASNPKASEQIAKNFAATCRQFLGIKIGPHAIIPQAASNLESTTKTTDESDREFIQSLRLLAADLVSTQLVLQDRIARRKPALQNNLPSEQSEKSLQNSK